MLGDVRLVPLSNSQILYILSALDDLSDKYDKIQDMFLNDDKMYDEIGECLDDVESLISHIDSYYVMEE